MVNYGIIQQPSYDQQPPWSSTLQSELPSSQNMEALILPPLTRKQAATSQHPSPFSTDHLGRWQRSGPSTRRAASSRGLPGGKYTPSRFEPDLYSSIPTDQPHYLSSISINENQFPLSLPKSIVDISSQHASMQLLAAKTMFKSYLVVVIGQAYRAMKGLGESMEAEPALTLKVESTKNWFRSSFSLKWLSESMYQNRLLSTRDM